MGHNSSVVIIHGGAFLGVRAAAKEIGLTHPGLLKQIAAGYIRHIRVNGHPLIPDWQVELRRKKKQEKFTVYKITDLSSDNPDKVYKAWRWESCRAILEKLPKAQYEQIEEDRAEWDVLDECHTKGLLQDIWEKGDKEVWTYLRPVNLWLMKIYEGEECKGAIYDMPDDVWKIWSDKLKNNFAEAYAALLEKASSNLKA